ncbi:MAG: hypothetical protein ACI8X3_002153, partial [Saprospiraceae bacterium]
NNIIAWEKQNGFSFTIEDYYPFIGGFHCATLDIRRKSKLGSYF